MFERIFIAHPRSVGETYGQHLAVATRFGATMIFSGLAVLLHGLVPAAFAHTGSSAIKRLYGEMKRRQPLLADQPPAFRSDAWQLEYEI